MYIICSDYVPDWVGERNELEVLAIESKSNFGFFLYGRFTFCKKEKMKNSEIILI